LLHQSLTDLARPLTSMGKDSLMFRRGIWRRVLSPNVACIRTSNEHLDGFQCLVQCNFGGDRNYRWSLNHPAFSSETSRVHQYYTSCISRVSMFMGETRDKRHIFNRETITMLLSRKWAQQKYVRCKFQGFRIRMYFLWECPRTDFALCFHAVFLFLA